MVEVSVCVMCYNQKSYIGQCLESLVKQETNFEFEIIVADDCSTDGTQDVILQYKAAYPNLIKPILRSKNIGAHRSFYELHGAAIGKYIAHIDGDDYALPGKLQLQYDFLESNPLCAMVWHRNLIENVATGEQRIDMLRLNELPKSGIDVSLFLCLTNIGLHSSKMYRSALKNFELPEFPLMDYYINVEQLQHGYGAFVPTNKPLGVYRLGIGISSGSSYTKKLQIKTMIHFSKKYPQFKKYINSAALFLLIADVVNMRAFFFYRLVTFIKTFHLHSVLILWKNRKLYSMLRFPF